MVSIHTPTKGVTADGLLHADIADVSIHTPTKGVTKYCYGDDKKLEVSIHTPTKGVTRVPSAPASRRRCFNPHTHDGCDILLFYAGNYNLVSIHTPTKGVT